jgi:hypothetical protein
MWTFHREVVQINDIKGFLMNKLLAALVAGLFAAGAFAQAPEPASAAPAAPAVHKAKAKHAVKKHKVRHVAKAHTAAAKKV